MKTFIATVEVEFTCTDEQMVRERVIGVPFGDSDLGFRIVKIEEGQLPAGTDECDLPEYRELHGCGPVSAHQNWSLASNLA
jgi:hypothetical protein